MGGLKFLIRLRFSFAHSLQDLSVPGWAVEIAPKQKEKTPTKPAKAPSGKAKASAKASGPSSSLSSDSVAAASTTASSDAGDVAVSSKSLTKLTKAAASAFQLDLVPTVVHFRYQNPSTYGKARPSYSVAPITIYALKVPKSSTKLFEAVDGQYFQLYRSQHTNMFPDKQVKPTPVVRKKAFDFACVLG